MERTVQELEQWTERCEEGGMTMIGGDFNARTGREGGRRNSKDWKMNGEGKRLVEFLEEKGWSILNGDTKGDEEGEYTFTGGRGTQLLIM